MKADGCPEVRRAYATERNCCRLRVNTNGVDTIVAREHAAHRLMVVRLISSRDGADAEPRMWITPPRRSAQAVDELTEAITPYEPVRRIPASLIKRWVTRPSNWPNSQPHRYTGMGGQAEIG